MGENAPLAPPLNLSTDVIKLIKFKFKIKLNLNYIFPLLPNYISSRWEAQETSLNPQVSMEIQANKQVLTNGII